MFRKLVPRCSECIYYRYGGVSKTYDLGMCSKIKFQESYYFAEMARLEPTKCGFEGVHFVKLEEDEKKVA